MLRASRHEILARLSSCDVLLDVGGWADPLDRADWVIDLMPYESRGLYEREGWVEGGSGGDERFTRDTWIQRDICDRAPWPFEDGQFDFVTCSHTLEDIRDPVWVCSEMARVGRAGYIEVPSRLEEQSWGVTGPFVGWEHHRWLIDVDPDARAIAFALKPHGIHTSAGVYFPPGFHASLSARERVETLWWEDHFSFSERVFVAESMDRYLADLVDRELASRGLQRRRPRNVRQRLAARLVGSRPRP